MRPSAALLALSLAAACSLADPSARNQKAIYEANGKISDIDSKLAAVASERQSVSSRPDSQAKTDELAALDAREKELQQARQEQEGIIKQHEQEIAAAEAEAKAATEREAAEKAAAEKAAAEAEAAAKAATEKEAAEKAAAEKGAAEKEAAEKAAAEKSAAEKEAAEKAAAEKAAAEKGAAEKDAAEKAAAEKA